MTYPGAADAAESRKLLGAALEALQSDSNIPDDVMSVASNIAQAVGALFEAENATSQVDGKACIKHAMGSLSQTMALLQDVQSQHEGIRMATKTLADVMQRLFPLAQVTSMRPSAAAGATAAQAEKVPQAAAVPAEAQRMSLPGVREKVEANVGATTESNFFVGFSGDISEGGVFVATYLTLSRDQLVEVLITLPGGYETTIPGKVRFVRDPMDMDSEPGIGVCFERLDAEQRELILRFIRKRPPLFYDE